MSVGIVTGRQYVKTRVRGYAPWDPKPETMVIIEWVEAVIIEYVIALTVRQIFYRLVGKYQYEKTELAYNRLGEYLNRARRAGLLDFDSFRDDGDIVPSVPGWESKEDFWDSARNAAERYFRTPEGDVYVEIWVETAGMAPQIQDVADPFGARAIGSGGFSSSTARRNAALRLEARAKAKPVHVIMIGDYDPSGQSIMDSAAEDVQAFSNAVFTFERLAVTPKQAAEYNLISAPQKDTDRRGEYMVETYQAEALDPPVLAEIVRARLASLIGERNVRKAKRLSKTERAELLAAIEKIKRK